MSGLCCQFCKGLLQLVLCRVVALKVSPYIIHSTDCLWIAISVTAFHSSDSLHCFSCSNILEDKDCNNVTQCTSSQKCYTERQGQGNRTRFSLGCVDTQHCPVHHDFTIVGRSASDHCMDCCIQDGCNKELCEVQHISDVVNPVHCIDDPATNCSHLSKLINICSDVHHAKTVCRSYCGLCSLADGDWAIWSRWSECSVSCGVGTHTRGRTCTNPAPQNKGAPCSGNGTQTHSCFTTACPEHGGWSNWGGWESCSVSCDEGVKRRHRTCSNPAPTVLGHYCIGDAVEYDICHEQPCNNVTSVPINHNKTCVDVLLDCDMLNSSTGFCSQQEQAMKLCKRFCNLCSIVDGQWAVWSPWSMCSASCDNGTWYRSRTCSAPPPANGGKTCPGSSTDTGVCNLRTCPVHGGWAPWEHWATCSSSCGPGLTKRLRSCTNPRPSLLGNPCFGESTDVGMCMVRPCPVNGQWTGWSAWYGCSVTCGSGHKIRQRSCSNPGPSNGGQNCRGVDTETITCNAGTCPVNGGWAPWSHWTSCSRSCNGGERSRHRTCSRPSPIGLGQQCVGNSDQVSVCNGTPCPGHIIGFTATGGALQSSHIVKFTRVKSNYGSGYSTSTGYFTCPHPGYYYLSASLIKPRDGHSSSDGIWCDLHHNAGTILTLYNDPTDDDSDKGAYETSGFAFVHLNVGDTVYIKCDTHFSTTTIHSYSSFSGFMLVSD